MGQYAKPHRDQPQSRPLITPSPSLNPTPPRKCRQAYPGQLVLRHIVVFKRSGQELCVLSQRLGGGGLGLLARAVKLAVARANLRVNVPAPTQPRVLLVQGTTVLSPTSLFVRGVPYTTNSRVIRRHRSHKVFRCHVHLSIITRHRRKVLKHFLGVGMSSNAVLVVAKHALLELVDLPHPTTALCHTHTHAHTRIGAVAATVAAAAAATRSLLSTSLLRMRASRHGDAERTSTQRAVSVVFTAAYTARDAASPPPIVRASNAAADGEWRTARAAAVEARRLSRRMVDGCR